VEEIRTTDMKRTLVLVILVSLVALLTFISGCTSVVAQTREPYTYSSEVYNAAKVSPASEQEVLNFLAQDTTDKNLWIVGVYECGHFAADLWWNAYMQGLEACMVWVKHWEQGMEQVHWLVKLRIEDETQNYWLWVEPSSDEVVDEDDYTMQDTYCGEQALNLCKTWWEERSRL
jgi:uncharacterized protein YceK